MIDPSGIPAASSSARRWARGSKKSGKASIADPNSSVIQFTYDSNGNKTSHTDANGNSTTYTFDNLNRVVSKTDALSNSETYSYDKSGNVLQRVDRKGQLTGWIYDSLNRNTQVGYGATSANPTVFSSTVAKTWDAGNRLTQIVDSASGSIISRNYDGLNHLTRETTPQGVINYSYDVGGRRIGMTVQGQPTVTYSWDTANRLTQIQQAAGVTNGEVIQTVSFQYDSGNRRTEVTLPNGIVISYAYDQSNHIIGITYTQANGVLIGTLTYGYDLAGHRTTVGGTLANVNLPDSIAGATYNANNELINWNGTTYSYDSNGNLLNDGTLAYTWDSRNQLALLGGAANAGFSYDGLGRRIGKVVDGTSTGFVYDGTNYVQEKAGTSSGDAVVANLLTGATDETFERQTSDGISALLTDILRSTVAETNAVGTVTTSYNYDAYGNTTQTGSSTGNAQQYTGRENDGTGLYYYRARYYSPSSARFTKEDPIGWASGQANNFKYGASNPISNADPSGEINCVQTIIASVGICIGIGYGPGFPEGDPDYPYDPPAIPLQTPPPEAPSGDAIGQPMPDPNQVPEQVPEPPVAPRPTPPPDTGDFDNTIDEGWNLWDLLKRFGPWGLLAVPSNGFPPKHPPSCLPGDLCKPPPSPPPHPISC